jgi:hypothetical protein
MMSGTYLVPADAAMSSESAGLVFLSFATVPLQERHWLELEGHRSYQNSSTETWECGIRIAEWLSSSAWLT